MLSAIGNLVRGLSSSSVSANGPHDQRVGRENVVDRAESGPASSPLTAGVCLSARLARLLAPEWRHVSIGRGTPIPTRGLDLVLLEVRDGKVPGWQGAGPEVADAVGQWSRHGVPVLVWCTSGSVADLPWLDQLAAVAVTTQAQYDVVQQLHDRVLLLPAAAQPRTHRPGTHFSGRRGGLVVFDERCVEAASSALTQVLGPALLPLPDRDVRLDHVRTKGALETLPSSLASRVAHTGTWEELEVTLGESRAVLDLSATCAEAAWTTVACAASGAAVVGSTALSGELPSGLGELVHRSDDAKQLRSELIARIQQEELSAREGHRARRAVLTSHTAAHRVRALAGGAGLAVPELPRSVSAIVPTNRAPEIDNILANLARQSHHDRELVLVLHGLDIGADAVRARAQNAGVSDVVVVHADASLTLGACMNLGVQASSGRYIAKMDDDNFYGEHYLTDLVQAFSHTSAGVVGKWCHYVWLRSTGAVVLRYPSSEHALERRIQGGSMLFESDVVRTLGFADLPRAVDSDILDRAAVEGVQIYSADRFNFVSVRGADRHAHTWTVADSTFMTQTGRLMFYGDPRPHVSV